jgi:ketosteroid isomerase-like protein
MLADMSPPSDPVQEALARYSAAAYDRNVDAFVSLYADDVHVFDMWNSWELQGIEAWRKMAAGWFSSLGDERVVVTARDVASSQSIDLAVGHATLTYTAISVDGRELRSLDNRITIALRRVGSVWKIFHEHTSGPIDHKTMSGVIKRGDSR